MVSFAVDGLVFCESPLSVVNYLVSKCVGCWHDLSSLVPCVPCIIFKNWPSISLVMKQTLRAFDDVNITKFWH